MNNTTTLLLTLLLTTPALAAPPDHWESAAPAKTCVERASEDPAVDQALRALTFEVNGQPRPLTDVRFAGATIKDADLWTLVGGRPEKLDAVRATAIVRRLAAAGLFSRIAPVLEAETDGIILTIRLTEYPRLTKVIFEGLTEAKPKALLAALLKTPALKKDAKDEDADDDDDDGDGDGDSDQTTVAEACPDPEVPRAWLATVEGDVVRPGVVWKGLHAGLDRVTAALFERGYRMSTLTAVLATDGVLTVRVDEGRLEAVELRGMAPRLDAAVRARLDLHPGQVFDSGELDGALARVRDAFPFLGGDDEFHDNRRPPKLIEEDGPAGERVFHAAEASPESHKDWYSVSGHRLIVSLRAHRADGAIDPTELLKHTPVTGFAPGLELRGHVWDPQNRVHLTIDAGGNVNTYRAHQGPSAQLPPPAEPTERWRFDWMVGPRLQIPALHLVELGAQWYARVDTSDRWRIDRLDSYLYSMLFDRPDAMYFHRTGVTAFATARFFERLTGGVEYRHDRYVSLASPQTKYWTLFNRNEAPRFTRPISDGTMGSLVLRLEYATTPTPDHKVGQTFRDPERALVDGDADWWWADFRTLATLEIADPSLGGDFHFVRLVSDSAAFLLRSGRHRGLKLRFRAAGALGGTLPEQKQEALGGWTALRGYGFEELAGGNFSLLGTAEYRFSFLSAFVDVGSLRRSSFEPPRTGLGLALNLGDEAQLSFAWRADDRAKWTPEVRLFFQRTY